MPPRVENNGRDLKGLINRCFKRGWIKSRTRVEWNKVSYRFFWNEQASAPLCAPATRGSESNFKNRAFHSTCPVQMSRTNGPLLRHCSMLRGGGEDGRGCDRVLSREFLKPIALLSSMLKRGSPPILTRIIGLSYFNRFISWYERASRQNIDNFRLLVQFATNLVSSLYNLGWVLLSRFNFRSLRNDHGGTKNCINVFYNRFVQFPANRNKIVTDRYRSLSFVRIVFDKLERS